MATNENGNLVDDAGNVAVDFVWGNFPLQPNDVREENGGALLDAALDNHKIAYEGWNGYPLYTPNTAGAEGAGFIVVPSVIGKTTAVATNILEDAGLVVTVGSAATNAAKTVTAASRTSGSTLCSLTVSAHGFSAGQLVVVTSVDSSINGTWVVDPSTTSGTLVVGTTPTTAKSLTGLTGSVVGLAGTVKTQSVAAGADSKVVGDAISIVAFAAAS